MNTQSMIPAGYMYKQVVPRPDWLADATQVCDICSVSDCIAELFADFTHHWVHNGYWFFDEPELMCLLAIDEKIDLSSLKLFYYEIYEYEFDDRIKSWSAFSRDSLDTFVKTASAKKLLGFDVATYSQRNAPEHSPLSCNGLAAEIPTNEHCLFATFDEAKAALETGLFDNSEPGPFRILAVYRID